MKVDKKKQNKICTYIGWTFAITGIVLVVALYISGCIFSMKTIFLNDNIYQNTSATLCTYSYFDDDHSDVPDWSIHVPPEREDGFERHCSESLKVWKTFDNFKPMKQCNSEICHNNHDSGIEFALASICMGLLLCLPFSCAICCEDKGGPDI